MSIVPSLSGKRLIKAIESFGFGVTRIKGSHHFLRHPDERTAVIPVHSNEDIGNGLLRKILVDCELTFEDLREKI